MDKTTFDLLTELVVMLDTRIKKADKNTRRANHDKLYGMKLYYEGRGAAYNNVAAWAREKMTAKRPTLLAKAMTDEMRSGRW